MIDKQYIFKSWVPEWLIKVTLFIVLLPGLVLFFLPMANVPAAAGNTGIETYDVLYSVVLFYAGYTSFFSLERRFFNFLAAKEYFILITFIQIACSFICYLTSEVAILFIFRFIQGMAFTMIVNLSLNLIYIRLTTKRARAIGYSVFFGMLVCMIPFNNFATSELIDSFNFHTVYKCAMFSYLPSLALIYILMNNIRLNVKFPLYQLDWLSFFLYALALCLIGYIMVYGQNYYWLEDSRILGSVITILLCTTIFVFRQLHQKRPYFNMEVFNYSNFAIGILIILAFYICRFALGITTNYFIIVLKLDPIHTGYINLFNIGGIIIGVVLSCVFLLTHRPIRLLWFYGFSMLLIYHAWMLFLFTTQANENNFYIPLIIQGFGVGMLMTPSIIFMVASVPDHLSATAAGICLCTRCLGFYISIGLLNFFELFSKSKHFNTFQNQITEINPVVNKTIAIMQTSLIKHGALPGRAAKSANHLLISSINTQGYIRYAIDYYEMICVMLILILLLVVLFPYINRTVLSLTKRQPSPF